MDTIKYRQTMWGKQLPGVSALTPVQYADHRVVVEGAKTNDAIANEVRHEDLPRRRHHGDTTGVVQRAGGSCQLPHPREIRGPQHRQPTVAWIHHEEEIFVGSERQTTRAIKLAGLLTLRTDGALPLALHLDRSRGAKTQHSNTSSKQYRTTQQKTEKHNKKYVVYVHVSFS